MKWKEFKEIENNMKVIYGMKVFKKRITDLGVYLSAYRISEMTGRELDRVTVVPEHVWENPRSPYFMSFELPASELITEEECLKVVDTEKLHPAMTI